VQSTARLCEGLASLGHEVSVFTTNAGLELHGDLLIGRETIRNGVRVWYFPAREGRLGIQSPALTRFARQTVATFDLAHITGVWQPTCIGACRAAERQGVPYVVSPRGALSAYSWTQKTLKKRLYYWLFEKHNEAKAAGIHYTSQQEKDECSLLNLPKTSCVIPNPLNLETWQRKESAGREWRQEMGYAENEKVFINVGRLHHKKGLDLLPPVLSNLATEDWRMVFVGKDEDGTQRGLVDAFSQNGLLGKVAFTGTMPPERLVAMYSGADLFLMPSRDENFGNVVIEALACGCPVVLSDSTGVWDQIDDLDLVTVLPREQSRWVACLENVLMSIPRQHQPFANYSAEIRNRFGCSKIASDMAKFYSDILAGRGGSM